MKKTVTIKKKNYVSETSIEQNTGEAIVSDLCAVGIITLCFKTVGFVYDKILKMVEQQ